MAKKIAILLFSLTLTKAFGYGTGIVSYPLVQDKSNATIEFNGMFGSDEKNIDGGLGLQARYTRRLTTRSIIEGGLGISSGSRAERIFVAYDYELFPDYQKQPRLSLKTSFVRADEFDGGHTNLDIAPVVSKGFSFWGTEAYPFFSLPIGLNLESNSSSYESTMAAAIGMTAQVPTKGYRHMMASIEGRVSIDDSYSGVFLGLTYQFE